MSPEKIAVLSDIHGNFDALKAVLTFLEEQDITTVWFLGDLFDPGPQPALTYSKLSRYLSEQDCVWLSGNHDKCLAQIAGITVEGGDQCYSRMAKKYILYAQITAEAVNSEWIQTAAQKPTCQYIDNSHFPGIYAAHGFPNEDPIASSMDYIQNHTPSDPKENEKIQSLRQKIAPASKIWITGHSHRQAAWLFDGEKWSCAIDDFGLAIDGTERGNSSSGIVLDKIFPFAAKENSLIILNPGSVGFPRDGCEGDGNNLAKFLTLEGEGKNEAIISFFSIPYQFSSKSRNLWKWYPDTISNLLKNNQEEESSE